MNELTSSDQSQLVLAVESILDKNNDICLDNELQGLQTYFNSPSLNQDIFQVVDNLKQTENNEDILKVDNKQDILKTDNIEYNDVNNEDILKVYDIDKVEDNVKHTNVYKEIDLDQENQTHYKVLNNEDTKNGSKQTEIENKVGEENNQIQDNIEDKDSQKERILNTLQQINQGYYAVSIVNDNNDEVNSQTPTVRYAPVFDEELTLEEKIKSLDEKLKDFPFCTKFIQPSTTQPVVCMKFFKRACTSDIDLEIIPNVEVSQLVYFDVSEINKVIHAKSEELNSEQMKNTRCFLMHKSYSKKVIEIRGATTIHNAVKVFVEMSKLRQRNSDKRKNKDPGVYSVFDRIDDDVTIHKYIHAPVVRDTLYVIMKRPYETAKGEKNYYDPLQREKTVATIFTKNAERDRKKFIHLELNSQLSRIMNDRQEAISKIEKRLNATNTTDFIKDIENVISKCVGQIKGNKYASFMPDIISSLAEQKTIMANIDKSIVLQEMNTHIEKQIYRLVDIIHNIKKTTHNESIMIMYMGSVSGEKSEKDIATYIIDYILPDPELFVSVITYVHDQEYVN